MDVFKKIKIISINILLFGCASTSQTQMTVSDLAIKASNALPQELRVQGSILNMFVSPKTENESTAVKKLSEKLINSSKKYPVILVVIENQNNANSVMKAALNNMDNKSLNNINIGFVDLMHNSNELIDLASTKGANLYLSTNN